MANTTETTTTETDFRLLLDTALDESEDFRHLASSVSSFEDAGLLTTNEGLVVRMADGAEFQVTVVRSA